MMSRKAVLLLLLIFCVAAAYSQYNINIEFSNLPANTRSQLFIAGSFNGWRANDPNYMFQRKENGEFYIDLKLPAGKYEYKITRGSWDKVETKKNGVGMENRLLIVEKDEMITISVEDWKDNYPAEEIKHSANAQVKIIDTAFYIPQLKRKRRIWIYLPVDYATGNQRYGVLYMHDGQNVFDDATSYSGEWGVDECLDTMMKKMIVVGIDNGGNKRIHEYCPYDFSLKSLGLSSSDSIHKGEGDLYVDFLVKTLKPFIDKKYRTLKDKNNTMIAGSSMGGIISMYALLKYPKVFGGAGVFSPAFWVGPKIFDEIRAKGKKLSSKIYFYAGKLEGETMVPLTLRAFDEMSKRSKSKMTTIIRDDGKHNEARWRIEFPLFYEWVTDLK